MRSLRDSCCLLALCALLCAIAGCREPRPLVSEPEPFPAERPGGWQAVKQPTLTVSRTRWQIRAVVAVEDYPTAPRDYVQRIELFDARGNRVGERVFEYGEKPTEAFVNIPPESGSIYAVITATGRGKWRTERVAVPAEPAPEK